MKYDIYGSFISGAGEYKIPVNRVKKLFTEDELKRMCGTEGEVIYKGDVMKFWAEEAIDYNLGIQV